MLVWTQFQFRRERGDYTGKKNINARKKPEKDLKCIRVHVKSILELLKF